MALEKGINTAEDVLWFAVLLIFAIFIGVLLFSFILGKEIPLEQFATRLEYVVCGNSPTSGCPASYSTVTLYPMSLDSRDTLVVFTKGGESIVGGWTNPALGDQITSYDNPCDGACVCIGSFRDRSEELKKRDCEELDLHGAQLGTIHDQAIGIEQLNSNSQLLITTGGFTPPNAEFETKDVLIPFDGSLLSVGKKIIRILYIEYFPEYNQLLITPHTDFTKERLQSFQGEQ